MSFHVCVSGYPHFVLYAYPFILEDANAKGADENTLDTALEAALGGLSGFDSSLKLHLNVEK